MTPLELRANSSTLIIAGSETTATTLTGTTYLLLRNPEKLAKLVHEIRSTFSSEDEITALGVNRLEYMAACFEESMRLYPAIPVGLPRRVPSTGAHICGQFVPGNVCSKADLAPTIAFQVLMNFVDFCLRDPLGCVSLGRPFQEPRFIRSRAMDQRRALCKRPEERFTAIPRRSSQLHWEKVRLDIGWRRWSC